MNTQPPAMIKLEHREVITKIKKERNALERKKLLLLKTVTFFKMMDTLYL